MTDKIKWDMSGTEIEQASFNCIENEYKGPEFSKEDWPVVRRMIHTTADFSIAKDIKFKNNPFKNAIQGLNKGVPIYCDSNMIRSGLSRYKLSQFNTIYKENNIHCFVANKKVAAIAKEKKITRSLAAAYEYKKLIHNGIVLIGNAPMALAGIIKLFHEENITPRLIIAMPVGFIHVLESKEMVMKTNIPQIVLDGRRGGSPLAVSALHGLLEAHL